MNLAPGLSQRLLDGFVQMALDQQIWAVGVNPDPGKIRPVPDAPQPAMQFHQVEVGAEKSRNDDYARAISVWDTETVIDGCRVQQKNFCREQGFSPRRDAVLRMRLG